MMSALVEKNFATLFYYVAILFEILLSSEQTINAIRKKLDKAKEAANEAKVLAKTEKLTAAKAKRLADKEAKAPANKLKREKAPAAENIKEETAFDIVEEVEEQSV